MSDLLFIRHAETDMAGTFCGHSDPPINATGHRQIHELVAAFSSQPIAEVYSSDRQRAITTARALADSLGVPCTQRDALREIDFGDWESLTWQQIETRDPSYAKRWIDAFPSLPAPNGERMDHFEARVLNEIAYLLRQSESHSDEKSIAVVTHAGVMRTILHRLCRLDGEEIWKRTKPYCCTFRYHRAQGVRR